MGTLAFDGSQLGSPVGSYLYRVAEDRWSWSDGLYELHGYAPQAVPATTELMLQHKHPDDVARAFEVLENAIQDGRPFSCYHRIIDAKGSVRSVLSVGHGVLDEDGTVGQISGFFVDLTEVRRTETQAEVEDALLRIAETRSFIDQAKGMIMLATGCGSREAFGLLRKYSSHKNVKLNDLARRMVESLPAQPHHADHACRATVLAFLEGVEEYSRPTAS